MPEKQAVAAATCSTQVEDVFAATQRSIANHDSLLRQLRQLHLNTEDKDIFFKNFMKCVHHTLVVYKREVRSQR